MDEEVKKQAAVDDAKVTAEPVTAVDGAQDGQDLDALLASYDEQTKTPVSPPETKTETPKTDEPPVWARNLQERYLQEDIKQASEEIFAGLEVSDRMRRAFLDQLAREKPQVGLAFLNKDRDPTSWKKLLPGIIKEARKEFPNAVKVDPEATADRNAVAAAVRGASATKPSAEPPPNLGRMTDAELRRYTMENFGFS